MLLRDAQAEQRRTGGSGPFVGSSVGEASEHPLGLLPGTNPSATRGLHLDTGPQLINHLDRLFGRGVVEELPIDHHDGREVARRVALHVFQRDLAVRGGLVVADP